MWSCNTVFAKLGVDVGLTDMVGTAEAFGFNAADVRIPFAVAQSTFDTSLDRAQLALSSIGQYNTRATPLQMAMVSAAVANGGSCARRTWWSGRRGAAGRPSPRPVRARCGRWCGRRPRGGCGS